MKTVIHPINLENLLNRGVDMGNLSKMVLRSDGLNELVSTHTKGFKSFDKRAKLIKELKNNNYFIDTLPNYQIIKKFPEELKQVNQKLNPISSADYNAAWE